MPSSKRPSASNGASVPRILMLGWGYPPDIDGGLDIHVARLFEELRDKALMQRWLFPRTGRRRKTA